MKFVNQKLVWLIFSLLAFSLQANAQEQPFDESVLSEKGRIAYQKLLKVELFAFRGIGYGGQRSEGYEALNVILGNEKRGKAILAFKSLVKNATIEGGLYGLLGLKFYRCDCFEKELLEFKTIKTSEDNKETLTYADGCTVHISYVTNVEKANFIYLVAKYVSI